MNVPKGKQEPLQSVKNRLMLKKERQGIEKFLFFEKYAKAEELSVLMKEPVKTSGRKLCRLLKKELRF